MQYKILMIFLFFMRLRSSHRSTIEFYIDIGLAGLSIFSGRVNKYTTKQTVIVLKGKIPL